MVMKMQGIIAGCGIKPDRYEAVQDGDINEAYCLYGENKKFFLKLNDAGLYPRKLFPGAFLFRDALFVSNSITGLVFREIFSLHIGVCIL